MKLVVARADGYIVYCNCSRRKAESLLEKYYDMSRDKRYYWLRQYGNVLDLQIKILLNDIVGIHTPEEFLEKFEKNIQKYLEFVKKEAETLPWVWNYDREVERANEDLESLKEMLNSKIEKAPRPKRENDAVKLVVINGDLYRFAKHKVKSVCVMDGGVALLLFSNTLWIDAVKVTLIVRLDAPDEAVFDGLAKLVEEEPEAMKSIHDVLAKVPASNCRVPDSVKDRLGAISTFLSMILA